MSNEQVVVLDSGPAAFRRGSARVEWQNDHWYWELRLDDDQYGMAIGGPAKTHRAATRAIRRHARREGMSQS